MLSAVNRLRQRADTTVIIAALTAVVGVLVRVFLLGGPLDVPDWRQADTAYMAYRMWQESPPQVLHPKTPFRGSADVKAAEFPVYPLVVSLVWKLLGRESLVAARLVSLGFFAGAVVYAFLAVRLLAGRRVAWFTVAVYTILPLGIPYSRMVHPDFCIVFFAHMFLYHGLSFFCRERVIDYLIAVLGCTLVFLMKAPYGFYFALPMALYVKRQWGGRTRSGIFLLGSMFVLPLLAGVWFNNWRIALERDYVESLVYPMKWTAESLRGRFFGTLEQRADLQKWSFLVRRTVILVVTVPGAVLGLWGMIAGWFNRYLKKAVGYVWTLVLGALLYTLVVFPMVVSAHEYYSIPYLFPAAAAIALGIEWFEQRLVQGKSAALLLILAILVYGTSYGLRRGPYLYGPPYFSFDWQRIVAGQIIERETRPDDLVLSVTLGRSTGWSDPRILYYAHRRGWARQAEDLSEEDLRLYISHGARTAALLMTPIYPPERENFGVLAGYPYQVREMRRGTNMIGYLALFDLSGRNPADIER